MVGASPAIRDREMRARGAVSESHCAERPLGRGVGRGEEALTGLGTASGSSFLWGGGGPAICAGPVGKPPGYASCGPGIWGP